MSWKRGEFEIATRVGCTGVKKTKVTGVIHDSGLFGIHKIRKERFVLTHIPTGRVAGGPPRQFQRDVKKFGEILLQHADWNFKLISQLGDSHNAAYRIAQKELK